MPKSTRYQGAILRDREILVTFELTQEADGVRLRITESGFDQLSPAQRGESFTRNDEGWTLQLRNIEGYLVPR